MDQANEIMAAIESELAKLWAAYHQLRAEQDRQQSALLAQINAVEARYRTLPHWSANVRFKDEPRFLAHDTDYATAETALQNWLTIQYGAEGWDIQETTSTLVHYVKPNAPAGSPALGWLDFHLPGQAKTGGDTA